MDKSAALHQLHMHDIELYPLPSALKEWIIYYSWELSNKDIPLIEAYCWSEEIKIKRATEEEIKAYEDFVKNEMIIKD